jgi:DNA-nicking Smr family endonuclease|tara:strand:+ start:212 stop:838 length:627 start_codon:yes stop_codon:yes gene_type:complete
VIPTISMKKTVDSVFQKAMDGVAPLKEGERKTVVRPRAQPTVGQLRRRRDAVAKGREENDRNQLTFGEIERVNPFDVLAWKKDGVQPRVFRRLAQGKYPIEATLDLHQRTVKEARDDVFRFIRSSSRNGFRSVVIVHGRGDRSDDPAKLKSYVAHWLVQLADVIGFHSAPRRDGGTGATFVLIRKSPSQKEENRERHGLKSDRPQPID